MEQPRSTNFIESNNIKANFDRYLAWWILFISIGYQYKLIFCGGLGIGLGQKWICYTMIHGITSNHWFEHLVYVPLMWVALHQVNQAVFGPGENEVISKKLRQRKWIGAFLAAIFIYGHGMHIMNTVEMWSRQNHGITTGPVYEQIWWIDEQLSHLIQFVTFFLLMAWFIAQDRLDRTHSKNIAIVSGVLHGIDRGVGVVEGDSSYLGIFLMGTIMVACAYRWYRHDKDFWRSWQDFFFRHSFIFCITMTLLLGFYSFFFGLDVQPSEMGSAAVQVAILGIVLIVIEIILVVGLDRLVRKKR